MIQYTSEQLKIWINQVLQFYLIEKLNNNKIINWMIKIIKNINLWILD